MDKKFKNLIKNIEKDPIYQSLLEIANENEKKILAELPTFVVSNLAPLFDFSQILQSDPQKMKEVEEIIKNKEQKK